MFSSIWSYIEKWADSLEYLISLLGLPEWANIMLFVFVISIPLYSIFCGVPYLLMRWRCNKLKQKITSDIKVKQDIQNKRLDRALRGDFLSVKEFNDAWIMPSFSVVSETKTRNGVPIKANVYEKVTKHGGGLKYFDEPGCYVILIFNAPVVGNDYNNYRDVYVGQSVKMYQRVRNHFSGKGNGDVYADIKYGKYVYVQFFPCDESDLNNKEKELINLFDATKSYNKTSGGSAARY